MMIDFLKLVRLPLLFTALADPVAGYCLGLPAGGAVSLTAVLPLLLASAALYAAGMVFNDCTDLIRDRTLHPERPLAAGRIPFPAAYGFGVGLSLAALLAAQVAGLRSGAVALGIALGILLYDGVTKRHGLLGALTMGGLRAGNVLLGFVAALPAGATPPMPQSLFLLAIFLYVTLLTLLSRLEEPPPRPRVFIGVVIAMAVVVVATNGALRGGGGGAGWTGFGLTFLLALAFLYKGLGVSREFDPGLVPVLVKMGVLGIIPLDAAAAAGTGHVQSAIAILVLLVPAIALLTGFVRVPGMEKAT